MTRILEQNGGVSLSADGKAYRVELWHESGDEVIIAFCSMRKAHPRPQIGTTTIQWIEKEIQNSTGSSVVCVRLEHRRENISREALEKFILATRNVQKGKRRLRKNGVS